LLFKLIALVCVLDLVISIAESAQSAADIGVCESFRDGQFITLDCLSSSKSFCCRDTIVTSERNITRLSKKCCSEEEFVEENWLVESSDGTKPTISRRETNYENILSPPTGQWQLVIFAWKESVLGAHRL
jgi:hypothetical protein